MRKWIFMVTVEDNIIFYERSTGGTNDDSFFRIRNIDECEFLRAVGTSKRRAVFEFFPNW